VEIWGYNSDKTLARPVIDKRHGSNSEAIQSELIENGLLLRYPKKSDGISENEGVFLPCSFWLVICLVYQEKIKEAEEIFARAIKTGNDLGLFSEEYDQKNQLMLGNFPQLFTHVFAIEAALALENYPSHQKFNL
jgi:GH15 family glucan-1,4-alpha-glucosidase